MPHQSDSLDRESVLAVKNWYPWSTSDYCSKWKKLNCWLLKKTILENQYVLLHFKEFGSYWDQFLSKYHPVYPKLFSHQIVVLSVCRLSPLVQADPSASLNPIQLVWWRGKRVGKRQKSLSFNKNWMPSLKDRTC